MTDKQCDILLHALGLDWPRSKMPRRNFYNSPPETDGHSDVLELVEAGYLERGDRDYYHATIDGVRMAVGLRVPDEAIERWFETGRWSWRAGGSLAERTT